LMNVQFSQIFFVTCKIYVDFSRKFHLNFISIKMFSKFPEKKYPCGKHPHKHHPISLLIFIISL
jgi:hypothetical protein